VLAKRDKHIKRKECKYYWIVQEIVVPWHFTRSGTPFSCFSFLKIHHYLFWCRIHLWFRLMGGLQAKSMTSQHYRAVTRWRICVTMATLWQQQDGGYALLFYIFNSTVIDWTCFILLSDVELFKEIELKGVDSIYLALGLRKWWACVDMVLIILWLIPLCLYMINQ